MQKFPKCGGGAGAQSTLGTLWDQTISLDIIQRRPLFKFHDPFLLVSIDFSASSQMMNSGLLKEPRFFFSTPNTPPFPPPALDSETDSQLLFSQYPAARSWPWCFKAMQRKRHFRIKFIKREGKKINGWHINMPITILEFRIKGEFQSMTSRAVNGDNGLQWNTETQPLCTSCLRIWCRPSVSDNLTVQSDSRAQVGEDKKTPWPPRSL